MSENEFILPSSPADRQQIKNAVTEITESLARIDAERDLIKEIVKDIKERFEVPPKRLRQWAKWQYTMSKETDVGFIQDTEAAYDALFKKTTDDEELDEV